MIIFVVIPYAVMDRWHMLPDWGVLRFIYLLFPIILAWQHAGFYIVLMVIFCELIIILLQRPLQKKAGGSRGGSTLHLGLSSHPYRQSHEHSMTEPSDYPSGRRLG